MMQVVNIITFLFLFSFSLLAQENIEGVYTNIEGQGRRILELKKGNLFDESSSAFLSHSSFISKGYYLVKEDSLLLFYDSLPSAYPPSKFTVKDKSDSIFREFGGAYKIKDDVASLTLIIQDYSGNPIKGCNVGFMNSNKPIFGKISDENGKVKAYTAGKLIETISIYGMGYKPIKISMDNLWGFKSLIKVELGKESNVAYNKNYKIEKFMISKLKNGKLCLKLLTDNQDCFLIQN